MDEGVLIVITIPKRSVIHEEVEEEEEEDRPPSFFWNASSSMDALGDEGQGATTMTSRCDLTSEMRASKLPKRTMPTNEKATESARPAVVPGA